jgi:hypothetical protein
MSSSLLNANVRLMTGDSELQHIPDILMSSTLPSMVNARLSHQAINSMNGNVIPIVSSGTRIDFVVPTGLGSGVIKPKSCYVSMGLTVTGPPGGVNYWTNPLTGTSSLINRVEIRAGGELIDTLLDADKTSNYLQTNFANPQFNATDQNMVFGGNCTECAPIMASSIGGQTMASAQGTGLNNLNGIAFSNTVPFTINIPILSGLFNNQKAFPMYLLESALTVSIYLNDIANSFGQSGLNLSNYTVNNPTFNFSRVHIEEDIAQAVKASMREQGAIYNLDFIAYSNYRASMPQGGGLTYIMTPHVKSLLGLVCLPIETNREGVATNQDFPSLPFSTANPNFNIQVFLDEQKLVQYNVDTLDKICLENKRLAKLAYNTNVCPSWIDDTRGLSIVNGKLSTSLLNGQLVSSPSYTQGNFSIGFNSCRFMDADIGYAGTKVDTVRFQLDGAATTAFTCYFILIHSACLSIDGNGRCRVDK